MIHAKPQHTFKASHSVKRPTSPPISSPLPAALPQEGPERVVLRRQSYLGLSSAASVLSLWAVVLGWSLTSPRAWDHPVLLCGAVLLMTFLDTGLFITAHDAMHRSLAPSFPRLNDALGRVSLWLFAQFSYAQVQPKHAAHHLRPASELDPDYHAPGRPGLLSWYLRFMCHYASPGQISRMALVLGLAVLAAGIAPERLLLFFVAPALLSSFQLFYFGTYLPHREPAGGYAEPHRARSSHWPAWLSFLSCYHFGYHLEHHSFPAVPWWRLPSLRRRFKR